ncbi:MAG: hypothetical protein EOP09_00930 [Proteobacteria bacterium]|nr:MAG: hypothetical protein EOP09_00930 [Pseudomonadota bacterium]
MSNVISLRAFKVLKQTEEEELAYRARILSLNKLELLEEMVNFQEERSERGYLTSQMMTRGKYLFKSLEEVADTQELKILARSYRRHLEHELQAERLKVLEQQTTNEGSF